eukprot:CAMPEP_0196825710 /NCGR_PEP_ID=MMETSP1362-20130617/93217_1 /TAXON_ID=163516 /ORGANISM="Leptocylindrus danicus, Strain CCMP1856" /LENGTH=148 /DNA_ID=CAMNT_0042206191 /DNA_START=393 /DNA_END=839 /DNA_ORIENTATION=+
MLCHSKTSNIPLPDDFIDTSMDVSAHLLPSDAPLYTNNQGAPHIDDEFASIDDDLDDKDASGNKPSETGHLRNVEHDTSAHGENKGVFNKGAAKKDMPQDGAKLDLESALICEEPVHRSNNVGNQGVRDASKTQGADIPVEIADESDD